MISIRKAQLNDLPAINEIYQKARDFMVENGNPTQWQGGYPAPELLRDDITIRNCLYLMEEDGIPHAAFAFMLGRDATYAVIENGNWLDDDTPYGTIHRVGSDGTLHHVFAAAADYCKTIISNLRVDTHKDNLPMQHVIAKYGFQYCGIIYVEDGSPRLAYQGKF